MKYSFLFVNANPGRVSDEVMRDVVEANLLQQHDDLAPSYGLLPALVSELPAGSSIPASTEEMTFVPVYFRPSGLGDPPGAVAFHWVNPDTGRPECHVLTDAVASLSGPGDFVDKLSTSASHECCECREDTYADDWSDLVDGRQEAKEICDRVQNATYGKKVASGRTVQVSNFLLAAAFSANTLPAGTKVDFMGLIPSDDPRRILPDRGDGAGGGYATIRDGNNVSQVDGDRVAALRYSHKTVAKWGVDVASLVDEWREEPTPVMPPSLPFDRSDVHYDPRREALAENASAAAERLLRWVKDHPDPVPDGIEESVLAGVKKRADTVVAEENAKLRGQAND